MLRQPIIAVLGHVDHGKTTLLDAIRGTVVAQNEPGKITQHIGATEIPKQTIESLSSGLLQRFNFELTIPGVLFIDTPGHEAFVNLRKRGGNIADLALLVVDINQGLQQQSIEAIEILKAYKTPFMVALTKIDMLTHWDSKKGSFLKNLGSQTREACLELDEKVYEIVGKLSELGFQSERFDRCADFKKEVAIVPCSGVTGEGIPELLVLIAGLSQRFMSKRLDISENEEPKGVVLEVREERGFGITVDVILYSGILHVNDYILVGGKNGVIKTKIRALLRPKPLTEIFDKKCTFESVEKVSAACGVKIAAPNLDDALAGSPVLLAKGKSAEALITKEIESVIVRSGHGLVVKANTLGSLEALVNMLRNQGISVGYADVGNITKKDVAEANSAKERDPLDAAIIGFSVQVDEHAEEEAEKLNIKIFRNDVIYKLLEDYNKWRAEQQELIKREREKKVIWPAKLKVLSNCIFRNCDPAIFGVSITIGKIRRNVSLMNSRGAVVGKILSIQREKKEIEEAHAGDEVAISVDKGVIGRNIKEGEVLYSYLPEKQFSSLDALELSDEEKKLVEEIKEMEKKTAKR